MKSKFGQVSIGCRFAHVSVSFGSKNSSPRNIAQVACTALIASALCFIAHECKQIALSKVSEDDDE